MFEQAQIVRRLPRLRHVGVRLAGVLVFGALITLSALIIATGPRAEPEVRAEKEWPVSFKTVSPQALEPSFQVYGRLESGQTAVLRAAISGTVSGVLFREGDWVDRGDVLAVLDDAELSLAVSAAESALRQAQANRSSVLTSFELAQELTAHHEAQALMAVTKRERFDTLHEQRMIADAQLDEVLQEANERAMTLARHKASLKDFPYQIARADAAVSEAQTRLQRAQLELSYSRLTAPFSGRVLSIDVAEGDRIAGGTSLLKLADFESLQIRAAIPVQTAQRLRQSLDRGQPLTGRALAGGVSEEFELLGLAGDIKPGQGGIDAFFGVDSDSVLALGSVVQLSLNLPAEPDVVSIPMHALYDNVRIYRIEQSRLQALEVERVGEYEDHLGNYQLLVRSPAIKAGDQIMISQLPTAVTGLLVVPVETNVATATELAAQWSSLE
ncbi:MAG: HlyD family efflux transporter periplasmic adaptor subunit [Pseudohongiella sp.]|nr:HlyD family efflux transporter periplasmic adaptor subunit [Pseudohongiella sp.]